jgi:uncharacterized delta-60 repeat protein
MLFRRTVTATAVVAVAVAVLQSPAVARAPGDLDPSFNGAGQATTRLGSDAEVNVLAMQGNKVVAGGWSTTPSGRVWSFARYLTYGGLDTTFGHRGRTRLELRHAHGVVDLRVLPSGKIVAVGRLGRKFGVAMLTKNGHLDRTFGGGDGIVRTGFGQRSATATCVTTISGGRIVVGGWSSAAGGFEQFALARYLPSGKLDTSFGSHGKVLTDFWAARSEYSWVNDLLRWPGSNKVLAVGNTQREGAPPGFDVAMARYTATGRPDRAFGGGDGRVRLNVPGGFIASAAVMQTGRTVLVGGYGSPGPGEDAALLRVLGDGRLDLSWGGGDGIVWHDAGTTDEFWTRLVRSGRRTVLVGEVDGDAALMRVEASGALDSTFGSGGLAVTAFPGGASVLRGVTIQRDGRIVAGGSAPTAGATTGFALERVLAD